MSNLGPAPIPNEDLLDALRQLADRLGRTPTTREMRDHGSYSETVYSDRFGSWSASLEAAGLDSDTRERPRIPAEDLLDEIRRLNDELGHTPTMREMRAHGDYGSRTYQRRFGSWSEAVEAAGLEPNRTGISQKYNRIIQQLQEAEQ